ncbi:hypothetical protein [Paenibacillus lactis]|uniref:hypothetical protein n=1 Tax=Paenibacillus lactis TaxID=228574 RepID=UPI0036CEBD40
MQPATWVTWKRKGKTRLGCKGRSRAFYGEGGLWLHSLASRGAVRISASVAVKIGKLEWSRQRVLPDFKGERIAPPPIYAPVAGEEVCSKALVGVPWKRKGKARLGCKGRSRAFYGGGGLWLHP